MKNKINNKFQLGQVLITKQLHDFVMKNDIPILKYLRRHSSCDWGDLDDEDWRQNNDAIDNNYPIISVYNVNNKKIFIVTEADKSTTTMCFADEY